MSRKANKAEEASLELMLDSTTMDVLTSKIMMSVFQQMTKAAIVKLKKELDKSTKKTLDSGTRPRLDRQNFPEREDPNFRMRGPYLQ